MKQTTNRSTKRLPLNAMNTDAVLVVAATLGYQWHKPLAVAPHVSLSPLCVYCPADFLAP